MGALSIIIHRSTNSPHVTIAFDGQDLSGSLIELVVTVSRLRTVVQSTATGELALTAPGSVRWTYTQALVDSLPDGVALPLDIYRTQGAAREKIAAGALTVYGIGKIWAGQSATVTVPGPQGPPGPQGAQGPTGAQGPQGDAATISIGTVTTGAPGTSAAVTNSGSASAAVLDIVIPRGDVGPAYDGGLIAQTLIDLGPSWWTADKHKLDGNAPVLSFDFVNARCMVGGNGGALSVAVLRTGGAKWYKRFDGVYELSASNALVFDYASGRRRMVQEGQSTNLVYPSAAPTAAFALTVSALPYTVSFWGTGAVALSGTHSATVTGTGANTRTVYTFTPTAGSLTLTPSGSVARWQLEVASMATSYIETTTAAVTRLTDVCPWSSGAASVLSAAGPNTVVMRGSFGRPSSGNITYLAGNVGVLRSGGSGAVVFDGSTNFTLLEAVLGVGLTNAGIVFGWSGASRIGCVSGGTARTHSSSVIADLSAIYLGPATGVQTGVRNELDEIDVWPVLGTSAGVQTQAHIYTP